MNKKSTILIVDDAADNRLLLSMILEDDYQILEADSGMRCLELVSELSPNLILLDVNMPGMSGYEVCVKLRQQVETKNIPVIFVSALDSAEERLEGFEAGCDEYITKPINEEDLTSKISFRLSYQKELSRVQLEARDAMNVAMEAMTSSSELGQVIQFVKSVQELNSIKAVGTAVINMVKDFGLTACALLKGAVPVHIACDELSMEAKVLDRFQYSAERVINVGIRTIIHSDDFVLLVKDMPLEDESRYGRLKDHLAVLCDIANGRLLTLNAQLNLVNQRKEILNKVISIIQNKIEEMTDKMKTHHAKIMHSMGAMVDELEDMLFGLGLEEDQEKALRDLASKTSTQFSEANQSTDKLNEDLGLILETLYKVLEVED